MQQLDAATTALAAFLAEQQQGLEALRRGQVSEALVHFKQLKDGYDQLDAPRKELNALIENLSRATIPEMFEEQSTKTVTIEDVRVGKYRFTVAQKVSCSMIDKDAGMKWLRDNGHGGIIQETVPAPTLSAFAKDLVQNQGLDLPGDLFKISTMNYTSINKG